MKRTLSFILSLVMVVGIFLSVPVGVVSFAADESSLVFTLNSDGNSYSVTDCATGASGKLTVPAVYNDLPVTSIGANAFKACTSLTEIVVPDGVTSFGDYSFANCTKLVSVTIPEGVQEIGICAFFNCKLLEDVQLPEAVTFIGKSAFASCKMIEKVVVPEGVQSVEYGVFSECSELCEVQLPEGITDIGKSAFANCEKLTEIQIPETVDTIGQKGFYNCTNLESVKIPEGIAKVDSYVFQGCSALIDVAIPQSATTIATKAFYNCGSIENVFYGGTQAEWAEVNTTTYNTNLTNAVVHYETDDHIFAEWEDITPATCTTAGEQCRKCLYCEYEETRVVEALGHDIVVDPAAVPTCTDPGSTEGSHCARCGQVFTSSEVVEALGHTVVIDEAVAPTCTEDGLTEGSHCSVCEQVIVAQEVVPATGHTVKVDKAVAPTCTDTGLTEGSHCSVCNEILVAQQDIPATGHNIVVDEAIAPTCIREGLTEGSHCSVCGYVEVAQEAIPVNGHTSSDWIIDAEATYEAAGSKHKECTVCGTILETEEIAQLIDESPKAELENINGGIKVKWDRVEGAVKYDIYRRIAGRTSWNKVRSAKAVILIDKGVKSGFTYEYLIRANVYNGKRLSYERIYTEAQQYIAMPKLSKISAVKNGVEIKWKAVGGAKSYIVYRYDAQAKQWEEIDTVKKLSYTDKTVKVKNGVEYRYSVVAQADELSAMNNVGISIKKFDATKLRSAKATKKGVELKWNEVEGATGYNIYRKSGRSHWVKVGTVDSEGKVTFTDKNVKKGTYSYNIRVCYGDALSAYSNAISCRVK